MRQHVSDGCVSIETSGTEASFRIRSLDPDRARKLATFLTTL